MLGQIEADVLAHREGGKQRARLKDHGHAILVPHAGVLDRFALDEDFPGIGSFQADDMFEQDALAAAARPHDDEQFPRIDLEGDALEHLQRAKAPPQIADFQADALGMCGGVAHFWM